jgi:hypothetical protein
MVFPLSLELTGVATIKLMKINCRETKMNIFKKQMFYFMLSQLMKLAKETIGDQERVKEFVGVILNAADGLFPEGSMGDKVVEGITAEIYETYGITDPDPNN